MRPFLALPIGVYFGIVLIKSEVASWFRIQAMFRFEEAHMYLVIASAVAVGALSIQLIKALGLRTLSGAPVPLRNKVFSRGTLLGGLVFGMGWAITGACPGPVYAQLGAGAWPAAATFAGVLAGVVLYAWLRPRLPH